MPRGHYSRHLTIKQLELLYLLLSLQWRPTYSQLGRMLHAGASMTHKRAKALQKKGYRV